MSILVFRPSNLEGIKKLARSIGREQNIPHYQALDQASRTAGYAEYAHAVRELQRGDTLVLSKLHPVFLTAYWRQKGKAGRETLKIMLPRSLMDTVARHQLQHVRQLSGFRVEFEDHLERRIDVDGQERSQEVLVAAARALRFMAVTNLRPATTQTQRRSMHGLSGMPGHDHESMWVHSEQSGWVYMDEPYDHHGEILFAKRTTWLAQRDDSPFLIAPQWEGLYYPGMAKPYLVMRDTSVGIRLGKVLKHLQDDYPAIIWDGESVGYHTAFVSPARQTAKKNRKPRPLPPWPGMERNGALPYGTPLSGGETFWRPAQRMPLESHVEVGRLLQSLSATRAMHARMHAHIDRVKCNLDDWVQREYPGEEMHHELFQGMYYGGNFPPLPDRDQQLQAVQRIQGVLKQQYTDVKPVRDLLRHLAKVEASL